MTKWFLLVLWIGYSILTFWMSQSLLQVYTEASRMIVIFPIAGFQIGFFTVLFFVLPLCLSRSKSKP